MTASLCILLYAYSGRKPMANFGNRFYADSSGNDLIIRMDIWAFEWYYHPDIIEDGSWNNDGKVYLTGTGAQRPVPFRDHRSDCRVERAEPRLPEIQNPSETSEAFLRLLLQSFSGPHGAGDVFLFKRETETGAISTTGKRTSIPAKQISAFFSAIPEAENP